MNEKLVRDVVAEVFEVVTERLDDVLRVLDVFRVLERCRSTVHVVIDFSSARSTSRITM